MTLKQATTSIRTFVNPTLIYYAQVLFISCLAVMPVQGLSIVDGVLLILGANNIYLALKVWWRIIVLHRDQNTDAGHWLWHWAYCRLLWVSSFVCAAVGFMLGAQLSMLGVAFADLLFLAIGLHNTWELTLGSCSIAKRAKPATMSSEQIYQMPHYCRGVPRAHPLFIN